MSSNLSRRPAPSVARAASRAIDRTTALGAIAAEDVAVMFEVGREVRRNLTHAGLERRAIEQVLPELSTQLEYLDQQLLLASITRLRRLEREL